MHEDDEATGIPLRDFSTDDEEQGKLYFGLPVTSGESPDDADPGRGKRF
jgi:hypothetical protein